MRRPLYLFCVAWLGLLFGTARAQTPTSSNSRPAPELRVAEQAPAFTGTLFFSPQQRREMERERKQQLSGAPKVASEDARSVINGVATRSDGRLTVWVDGQPRWESSSARHVAKLSSADVGASAGLLRQSDMEPTKGAARPAASKPRVKRASKSYKPPSK